MKALEQAIMTWGQGVGSDVVKVDMFLNHRIDVGLSTQMGQAFYEAFKGERVDCILTVEASGIAVAITTAQAFGNIPVVFAKKGSHTNVGSDVYSSSVYSFTHRTMNAIQVSKAYLKTGERVLIIDDFLANGEAIRGLMDIISQAGCRLVGAGVCVEKGFQPGGSQLRAQGVKVVSLAVVDSITDGKIRLRAADEE